MTRDRRDFLKRAGLGTAAMVVGTAHGASADVYASSMAESFVETWKRAADCTLEFAEAMPADKYDFKPVDEVRSYADQMMHIASASVWFLNTYITGKDVPEMDWSFEGRSKEQLIETMNESFEYISTEIAGLSDELLQEPVETYMGVITKGQVAWVMRDHVTHHRGQCVVYLRLNGIEPPAWVGH